MGDWDKWQDIMAEARASVDRSMQAVIKAPVFMVGEKMRFPIPGSGGQDALEGSITEVDRERGIIRVVLDGRVHAVQTTVRVQTGASVKCTCGSASTPGLEGCCASYCDLVTGDIDRG